jgi:ABC-type oligopeptide transport system substrate-binding subunit
VAGGPFIINKIDKTAKTITVKRNDKCWGPKPKLQAITFIVLDVSGQAKAFQSDQIDCFDIGPDPAAYKQAQAVASAEVRKAGGPNFRHIDLGQKGPMSDLQVRQVVMLSLDRVNDAKATLTSLDWPATTMDSHIWTNNQAYGDPTAGELAGGLTPPGIPGYKAGFDPYPSGTDGSGDVTKAKAELQKCGKPNGFSTKYAYGTPSDQAANAFKLERTALGRVGIKVTATTSDSSTYYSTFIGSPANLKNQGIGIAAAGWGADFPTGVGFFQNITNGNAILPTGNSNYASLNDPTVNKILDAAPKGGVTEEQWQQLNQAVLASGTYLPVYYGKQLFYRNPRMTNVTCDTALAFGAYDFVNVGVNG